MSAAFEKQMELTENMTPSEYRRSVILVDTKLFPIIGVPATIILSYFQKYRNEHEEPFTYPATLLSQHSNLSIRTVHKAIQKLIGHGILIKHPRKSMDPKIWYSWNRE